MELDYIVRKKLEKRRGEQRSMVEKMIWDKGVEGQNNEDKKILKKS